MPFDLTPEESWTIVALKLQCLSIREIETAVAGKHRKTQIFNVVQYFANYGEVPKYRQHKRHKQEAEKSLDTLALDRLEFLYEEEDPCLLTFYHARSSDLVIQYNKVS